MSDLHQNFIAGEWITGAGVTRNINPSNTNDVVGEYAQADSAQAATAIAAAKAAATGWARSTPQERYDGAHLRFVKILVPEISESVVLDHNAEGQEIT